MTVIGGILRFASAGSIVCVVAITAALLSGRSAAQVNVKPILTTDTINLPTPCLGAFPCFLTKKFIPNPSDPRNPRTIVVDPRLNTDIAAVIHYYRQIGAYRSPSAGGASTLTNFKIKNQFVLSDRSTPRNAGFQAFYFNNGDLQLGREMHCNQNGAKIACYVSNYGPPPFPAGNTIDNNTTYPDSAQALSEVESVAINSANAQPPFATVAMEYLGEPPKTKTDITVKEADGITNNPNPPKSCLADYSGNAPPSNADVDTGLDVETGDKITVTATGSVWTGYCFTGRNSADGMANSGNADYPLDTAHEQALIGRVGTSPYFEIGSGPSGQFQIPPHIINDPPGRLFLRTNDNNPGNGSGSFNVTVTITRPQLVRFYVYGPDGSLAPAAALDREGNKLVPQMCMACHGGIYDNATDQALGASFLPFDVFSFLYSQKSGLTLNDQQEQFRQLNLLVKRTNPNPGNQDNPIGNLIDALYNNNVAGFQQRAVVPKTPSTWLGHDALYQTFVARYCRTCHSAANQALDFFSFEGFAHAPSVGGDLCNGQMPHAQVPYTALAGTRIDPSAAKDLRAIGLPCLVEQRLKPILPVRPHH
jgi:hypothetical protein